MAKSDKKTTDKALPADAADKFKRSPFLYVGSFVILILITITFIAGDFLSSWGGGSGGDYVFGYYDKVPILYVPGNRFSQNYEQVSRYYQSQGVDISNVWNSAEIWRQAFEMTVTSTAVLQIMKRSNYSVPEKTVDRTVALMPQFQENGRFSSVLYNQMSDSSRLSIWRQIQDELTINTYYNDLFYGTLISKGEADFVGNMTSKMRTFEVVSFNIDNFPESEFVIYAMENSDLFRSIHLSRISISSSERDARSILESIRNGTTTFEDAARAQSQDSFADRGGDMGVRYSYELESDIPNFRDREIILALRRGEMSDVLQVEDRWVFFRVEDELKQPDFADETVMERVRSYYTYYDRGRMEDWAIAQAREFIADVETSGMNSALGLWNMGKTNFGPIPINYGGVDLFSSLESFPVSGLSEQDVSSLSKNENFWKVAFSTQLYTPSEPLVQGSNVLVLFPVEEVDVSDSTAVNIASIYSSYWAYLITEQSLQSYFANNPRMNDIFWDAFFRYLMPQ